MTGSRMGEVLLFEWTWAGDALRSELEPVGGPSGPADPPVSPSPSAAARR